MDNTVSISKQAPDENDPLSTVAQDMATLLNQISTMETFIKRRFDEISMEINATSQQIDMSEDGMAKRFGEILGVMNAISFSGDGTTPANTGVELEAVIADTSKAANTILDCADRMNELLCASEDVLWGNPDLRAHAINSLQSDVQNIMVACSFQDIAGQRIRRTLDSINDIEDKIETALESMGIGPETLHVAAGTDPLVQSGASQDEIDKLFS